MLCVLLVLLVVIMCLHPKLDLYRNETTIDVADLEQFDTCDYLHPVKNVHPDDLIVMQLNIRGLYSKIPLLTHLLSSCANGRSPDLVLLSETWLTPASPPVVVPGYDLVLHLAQQARWRSWNIGIQKS